MPPYVPVSAVPRAKRALLAALAQRPALAGVDVLWDVDEDEGGDTERTVIALLDSRARQAPAGMRNDGGTPIDEALTIRLAVTHVAMGAAPDVEVRVWEIAQEIADTIQADRSLGGTIKGALTVSDLQQEAHRLGRSDLWEQRLVITIRAPKVLLRAQPRPA